MASKIKKNEKFDVGDTIRAAARELIGQPKATQAITPKKHRDPKYKENLLDTDGQD